METLLNFSCLTTFPLILILLLLLHKPPRRIHIHTIHLSLPSFIYSVQQPHTSQHLHINHLPQLTPQNHHQTNNYKSKFEKASQKYNAQLTHLQLLNKTIPKANAKQIKLTNSINSLLDLLLEYKSSQQHKPSPENKCLKTSVSEASLLSYDTLNVITTSSSKRKQREDGRMKAKSVKVSIFHSTYLDIIEITS